MTNPECEGGRRMAVVIPAMDEEEAIGEAIDALPPELRGRVVVVDNGSRDGTARVARQRGAEVVQEPRPGYGRACLAGLGYLEGAVPPTDVVLFVDADHRQGPDHLRRVVEPALEGEADLVLGVREEGGSSALRRPPAARWGTALVLFLARTIHGAPFRDLPPVRAVGREGLRRLEMDDPHFGWTLQMQLRAHRAGLSIREVGLPHRERTRGRSKISGSLRASIRAGARMLQVIVKERRWSPPESPAGSPGTPSGVPRPGGGRTQA